jgi:hypothetical protein
VRVGLIERRRQSQGRTYRCRGATPPGTVVLMMPCADADLSRSGSRPARAACVARASRVAARHVLISWVIQATPRRS